jgi:hypothetical protein
MRLPAALLVVLVAVAGCFDEGTPSNPADGCPSTLQLCGSTCVNVQADNTNCGACGNVCDAGEVCSAGVCALSCPAGELACGGGCIDPDTDRMHCGATADCEGANAGDTCDAGEVCNSGVCELSCQAGLLACNGTCIDPMTDRTYCGATADCAGANAGEACDAGEVCNGSGACELSCQAGLLQCGGTCIDPLTDRAHCGATADCAGANAGDTCDAGEVCNGSGVCELSCQPGLVACNGTCIDPLSDRAFCGAAADCQGANAGHTCDADEICNGSGLCELSCQPGLLACNGTCIDPLSDRTHCGATADCQGANAGDTCDAGEICNGSGVCELSCQANLLACNGTCIDPASNHTYCGASADCMGANAGVTCAINEGCDAGVCRPFVPFSNVTFPVAVAGPMSGSGQLEMAFGGDLFVAGLDTKDIFRVSQLDGTVTTFATDVTTSTNLLSLAFDPAANVLYAGSDGGTLVRVSSAGAVSSFATVAGQLNTLAIAPAGFGAYGGQVIVGSTLGLYAVDPSTSPATVTAISTSAGNISDLTFLGGMLYAVTGNSVVIIEPDDTVTPVTILSGSVDGIVYDPKRNVFYVADSTNDELYTVATDGTATTMGSYDFDSGFFISGLVLVNPDLLVIGTGETSLSLSSLALP